MEKRYYVYAWLIPNTETPFYIGKGTLTRSINFHQSGRCENKRQKLLKEGFTNNEIVKIIQNNLTEKEALIIEEDLINKYKRVEDGGTLLNYKVVNQKGYKIIDPSITNYIVDLYKNKRLTAKAIGEKVGLHETSVLRYLKIAGIKAYNRGSRFKFNLDEIKNIISLYESGISAVKISKKFNCSVPTICVLLEQNKIFIRGRKKLIL